MVEVIDYDSLMEQGELIYVEIPDFPAYEISSNGIVRKKAKWNNSKKKLESAKVMKTYADAGSEYVKLYNPVTKKQSNRYIETLVRKAFYNSVQGMDYSSHSIRQVIPLPEDISEQKLNYLIMIGLM